MSLTDGAPQLSPSGGRDGPETWGQEASSPWGHQPHNQVQGQGHVAPEGVGVYGSGGVRKRWGADNGPFPPQMPMIGGVVASEGATPPSSSRRRGGNGSGYPGMTGGEGFGVGGSRSTEQGFRAAEGQRNNAHQRNINPYQPVAAGKALQLDMAARASRDVKSEDQGPQRGATMAMNNDLDSLDSFLRAERQPSGSSVELQYQQQQRHPSSAAGASPHPFEPSTIPGVYSPMLARPVPWGNQQQRFPIASGGGSYASGAGVGGYYTPPPQGQTPSCQVAHPTPSWGGRPQQPGEGGGGFTPRPAPWGIDGGVPSPASRQTAALPSPQPQQQHRSPLWGGAQGGGGEAYVGGGSPAARKAMLAQRAGAGAAECFQW